MKRLLLILPILLTGCNQLKQITGTNDTMAKGASATIYTVLVMGQSNALNLSLGSMGGLEGGDGGAVMLSKLLNRPVRMINCAEGGTSILQWQKREPLYDACMARAAGLKIDAIWFDQGEYELQNVPTIGTGPVQAWEQNFTRMVRDLQADLGPVPVFFARLEFEDWQYDPNYATLRDQQTNVSCATMVSLDGISTVNAPHYSHDGYAEIARRLANAIKMSSI